MSTWQLQPSLTSRGPWESPAPLNCCVISRTELGLSELLFLHCRGCVADKVGSQEASVGFCSGSPAHTSIYTLLEGYEEAEVRFEPWSAGFQVLCWVSSTPQTYTLPPYPVYLPRPGVPCSWLGHQPPEASDSLVEATGPFVINLTSSFLPRNCPKEQVTIIFKTRLYQRPPLLAGQSTPQHPPGNPEICT